MSYAALKQRLDDGAIVVLDGATGTELQRRGAPMDPSGWCGPATLGHDRMLTEILADYIAAGSEVITANTFAASRLMLKGAGLADRSAEITRRAVEAALAARAAAPDGGRVVVAGSLSHMVPVAAGTDNVDPSKIGSTDEIAEAFGELAATLKSAGADLIILEMMYEPKRVRLALDAALATGLPVWFGSSARRAVNGSVLAFHHLDDLPLDAIAGLIPAVGVDVAGVMHTGAELIADAVAVIRGRFKGPLMAYPDSGYFEMPDWRFVDIIAPERLQAFAESWMRSGVQLVGGCCGLTVAHVEAVVHARDAVMAERARR